MGLLRALFWSALVAACAFALVVYFQYGASGFAEGATAQVESLLARLRSLAGTRN